MAPAEGSVLFLGNTEPKVPGRRPKDKRKGANEDFQRVARRLGMPVGREAGYTLHALRRFFETFCVNSGVPQRAIDVWMGHRSDRSMAAIYYALSDADSEAMMSRVPFSVDPPASGGDVLTQSHQA